MALIIFGFLFLVGSGLIYIYSNGNLNSGDFWWDHYGSKTYDNMVNLRDASMLFMGIGVILIIIGIIVYIVGKSKKTEKIAYVRQCPSCSMTVNASSVFCPTCGASLQIPPQPSGVKRCSNCGNQLAYNDKFCSKCGMMSVNQNTGN